MIFYLFVLTVAALFLTYHYVEEDKTKIPGFTFKSLFLNRKIQAISCFRTFYAFAVTLTRTYVAVFGRLVLSLSATQIGFVLAAEKIVNMFVQRFTGQLSDKHGRFHMLFTGGILYALGVFFVPFQKTFWTLALINGFLGFADSIREPASMALFADEGKGNGIASSFSVRSVIWKPGAVLAPLLGGLLMDWKGFYYLFWSASILTVLGLILMGIFLSIQRKRDKSYEKKKRHDSKHY